MKKVIVSLVLCFILVTLFLQGVQFHRLAASIRQVQLPYVLLSIVMIFLAQLLRSLRWGIILKPVAHVDPLTLFGMNNVGYLAIVTIPARLGELIRPLLISRQKEIPMAAALGTVCVERIMDAFTITIMAALVFPLIPLPSQMVRSISLVMIITLAVVVCFTVLIVKRSSLKRALRWLSFFREQYTGRINHLFGQFSKSFAVIKDGNILIGLVFLSFVIWTAHLLAIYALLLAFGYSLSPLATFVVMCTMIFQFIIPVSPLLAGSGPHICIPALTMFGLDQTQALSFALVYHALYVGLVLVLGLAFLLRIIKATWDNLEREVLNFFSMIFSSVVGLVELRRGKLYQRKDVLADIHNRLKSGDILLDKTPFRLTDKLIPGYWGHAALWIGTEAELKDMGIWDHPIVARYQKEICKGKMVVEALRSGVEMNTLEHFLNIDSIGILRKPDQNDEELACTVIRALHEVGKPYDFNFEVETRNRVYCSKLVYLSYASVEWPTRKSLGRATITPDDVAIPAALYGKLELVSFYHDGRRVDDRPTIKMAQLMRLEVN